MSQHLLLGFELLPTPREDERGGNVTKYELYHVRAHLLGVTMEGNKKRTTHSTILASPARTYNQATMALEDQLVQEAAVPGSAIDVERIGREPRKFRFWRPAAGESGLRKGIVVGHLALFQPVEYFGGQRILPQVIPVVALLVELEDRSHRVIHARVYEPGQKTLPADKLPASETFYTWQWIRTAFPMDSELQFQAIHQDRKSFYKVDAPDLEALQGAAEKTALLNLASSWGATLR